MNKKQKLLEKLGGRPAKNLKELKEHKYIININTPRKYDLLVYPIEKKAYLKESEESRSSRGIHNDPDSFDPCALILYGTRHRYGVEFETTEEGINLANSKITSIPGEKNGFIFKNIEEKTKKNILDNDCIVTKNSVCKKELYVAEKDTPLSDYLKNKIGPIYTEDRADYKKRKAEARKKRLGIEGKVWINNFF